MNNRTMTNDLNSNNTQLYRNALQKTGFPWIRFIFAFSMIIEWLFLVGSILFKETDHINTAVIAWTSSLVTIGYCFSLGKYRRYGLNMVVLVYTILSHFGYTFSHSLFGDAANTRWAYIQGLASSGGYKYAIVLAALAILTYGLVAGYYSRRNVIDIDVIEKADPEYIHEGFIFYSQIIIIIIISVLCLVVYITVGDLAYSERSRLNGGIYRRMRYFSYFSENCFPLIIALCERKRIKQALPFYLLLCIVQMLLGNRGEIMYGLVVSLAIYAMRFKNVNYKKLILFFLASVIILPSVAVIRENGVISSFRFSSQLASFFSELGFQIVPTRYTVDYIQSGGAFQYGLTYVYNMFLRLNNWFGTTTPEMQKSMAVVDNMLPQFGYGLGYSQVAEGFYNFGVFGVIGEFYILSRLSMFFERKISLPKTQGTIMYICLAVNMVNITRNKFDSTIIFVFYGAVIYLINNILVSRHRKSL